MTPSSLGFFIGGYNELGFQEILNQKYNWEAPACILIVQAFSYHSTLWWTNSLQLKMAIYSEFSH